MGGALRQRTAQQSHNIQTHCPPLTAGSATIRPSRQPHNLPSLFRRSDFRCPRRHVSSDGRSVQTPWYTWPDALRSTLSTSSVHSAYAHTTAYLVTCMPQNSLVGAGMGECWHLLASKQMGKYTRSTAGTCIHQCLLN